MITCSKCGHKNKDTSAFCANCGSQLVEGSRIFIGADRKRKKVEATRIFTQESTFQPKTIQNGRYELKKELGAGGMGRIYLAVDHKMEAKVVVKEMLPLAATPEEKAYFEKRFREEAKLLFTLKHEGLPRVTDYFEESGNLYIIMEFIEGKDLETFIEQKPDHRISIDQFKSWMGKLIVVLKYLHEQDPPIFHRDIKPSNLMITPKGNIILVDFGVARTGGIQTRTKTAVGTFGYASPEHFSGKYVLSSDIFSLGATFHFLLTGDDPQEREAFDYPPITKYRDDFPREFQKMLDKMVAVRRKNRYKNVEELERDFNNFLSSRETGKATEKRESKKADRSREETLFIPPETESPILNAPPPIIDVPIREEAEIPQKKLSTGVEKKAKAEKPAVKKDTPQKHKEKKSSGLGKIAFIFFLIVFVLGGGYFAVKNLAGKPGKEKIEPYESPVRTVNEESPVKEEPKKEEPFDKKEPEVPSQTKETWTNMPEKSFGKPLVHLADKESLKVPEVDPDKKPGIYDVEYSIGSKSIVDKGKKYNIEIIYPVMSDLPDKAKEEDFNRVVFEHIKNRYNDFKKGLEEEVINKYTLDYNYEIKFKSRRLLSVVLQGHAYMGGAHGNDEFFTVVYDIERGKELNLSDFFMEKADYLGRVSDFCVEHFKKKLLPNGDSDEQWIMNGAGPEPKNYTLFIANADEFEFIFPPYVVASYGAGPQTVIVPYKQLTNILDKDGPLRDFIK